MKVKEDNLNQKEAELQNHFQDTTQKNFGSSALASQT